MGTFTLKHFLFSAVLMCAFTSFAQNTCTIESYYSSQEIFSTDSVYEKVDINGKKFTIKVLYDKKNEYLEDVGELDDYAFSSHSPITLVISNSDDGKIVYAKKFGFELPRLFKASKDLTDEGKLFLSWFSSGGGSGYSLNTYLLTLQDDQIVMDEVMETNELSYRVYNKNDNEIYLLQGIWEINTENMDESEAHFSDHKYEIIVYHYGPDGYESDSKGVTKNKYSSEFENPKDLLRQMIRKETFLPNEIDVTNFY